MVIQVSGGVRGACNDVGLATLEFALQVVGVERIVILDHEDCTCCETAISRNASVSASGDRSIVVELLLWDKNGTLSRTERKVGVRSVRMGPVFQGSLTSIT